MTGPIERIESLKRRRSTDTELKLILTSGGKFVSYILGHKQLLSNSVAERQTPAFKNLILEFISSICI